MPIVKVVEFTENVAEITFDLQSLRGISFEGIVREDISVQFYGPLRDRVSMANVSFSFFDVLRRSIKNTAIHNYLGEKWIESDLKSHAFINQNAPVGIFLGVPDHVADSFYRHPFKIGCFVCETDRIHRRWVTVCNRMDLIVVPSEWCKSAFKRSGVLTPILIVPYGLDPQYRPYKAKSFDSPFIFFNTFRSSSLASRKGLEELIRCFLRAFENREDVVLRLRTDQSPALEDCRKKYDFRDLIQIETFQSYDTETFARMYSDVHCTVHPSRGEGFGLIPFQSIACETPVIAPHSTGMADYLSDENSIALRTAGRIEGEAIGNAVGTYFNVDEEHLVERLRYTFENWPIEYEKVRRVAPEFRNRYTWQSVMQEFVLLVQEVIGSTDLHATKRAIAERIH